MKNYKRTLKLALCMVLTVLAFCTCVYAEGATEQKVVCTYNAEDNTLQADIYVSSGTAIVGYCSLDYDENILTLLDLDGNVVPANVPSYAQDNKTIYLKSVIQEHNGVVVTDIGNGTKKLINTTDGYAMYAWYYSDSKSVIDAGNGDVLIASVKFALNSNSTVSDISESSIVFASSEITGNITGWYPAIFVMDKDQKQYSYADGTLKADIIFNLPEEDEQPTTDPVPDDSEDSENSDENTNADDADKDDESTDTPDTTPDTDTEKVPDDTDTENTPDENIPTDNETNTDEGEGAEDNTDTENEDTTDNDSVIQDEEDTEEEDIDSNITKYPFGLKYESTETTIRLKWERPENIAIEYYTITLSDSYGQEIRYIDGISSVTGSYTLKDLAHNFTYHVTLTALTEDGLLLTQEEFEATTANFEGTPETIFCTVTYNAGDGHIYGSDNESVVFGKTAEKIPDVIAPNGLYFIGWSADGQKICDISTIRIYEDITYFAVYTDFPDAYVKGYINGYEDGTFKPEGTITRAESAALFARVSGYSQGDIYENGFSDVTSGDWFEGVVSFCSENGYISGYEDGSFRPQNTITRAEFAAIVCRMFGFESMEQTDHYSDISSHWARNYANALYENCDSLPFGNTNFRPDRKITRREAVLVLSCALGRIPDKDAIIDYVRENGNDGKIFTDVSISDPDFFVIADAAIGKPDYN